MSTIQLSYPSIPLHGELFLCRPSIGERYSRADPLILHPLASYFDVYHITFHPSIPLASYFCAIPPLGNLFSCQLFNSSVFSELFSCRPYISPPVHPFGELFLCRPSLGRVIFVPTILFSILWRVIFHADHLTLHVSILLASYFCAVHPLGELFSCLPFYSPSFGELFFMLTI